MNFLLSDNFLKKLIDEKDVKTIEFIIKMIEIAISSEGTVEFEEWPFTRTLKNKTDVEDFKQMVKNLIEV